MEAKILLRGLAVGVLAGLLAFVFARLFVEPILQSAIDYQSGRDVAQSALEKAAGKAVETAGADPFSRGVQRNIGIGIGLALFGVALGGLAAVVYAVSSRYALGVLRPRELALRVAAAGFLVLFLVPFLKYPNNPPAIGHEDTLGARSGLYLLMVLTAAVALAASVAVAGRLRDELGRGNANLVAGLTFAVIVGGVMLVLPPLGELDSNVREFGRHATETPLPLRDSSGTIVFPGFPADVLAKFRVYSIINQLVLWGSIGLGLGFLVERLPTHLPVAQRQSAGSSLAIA